MLNLLKESLSARRRNVNIAREIDEGNDIIQIAHKYKIEPVKSDFQLQFEPRWWLEKLFDRIHVSFTQGTLLIYGLITIPRLFFLPCIAFSEQEAFRLAYAASYIGDMFVIIALLLVHVVQKGILDLVKDVNVSLKKKRFVSPPSLIHEEDMEKNERLRELDKTYQNFYVKPVTCKTLQVGLNLAFNKSYQIGSGIIAAITFLAMMLMRFVFNVIPPSIFSFWEPIPEIAFAWRMYSFFMITYLWFLVGTLAWTLFIVFMVIIQASGNTIEIRPFESIKECFDSVTALTLKTSFTVTFLVGWFSPYMLVWSMLPPDPFYRQSATNFVESVLVVMIPVIIISFLIPILKIHKGMYRSRDRALLIKREELEQLKKTPIGDLDKHLKIQQHLIEDYRSIQGSSEWVLNIAQAAEIIAAVLLPIATFLISRLFQ